MTRRYTDPVYADIAKRFEEKYQLPKGILDAIRLRGERSNADQVSEAGARSVYQFIPSTRRGFMKQYGIDPWSGPEAASEAAALHLRDDYQKTGSWDKAILRYHGGPNERRWGPRTRAYIERTGSFDQGGHMPQQYYPYAIGGPKLHSDEELSPLPERPTEPMPIPGDMGPSVSVPSAAVPATKKKRGGILGALESVFMPDADSLWGSALRNGVWEAKAGQQLYRQEQAKAATAQAEADVKLKNLMRGGEYKIAGNNIVHYPPDGGEPRIITAPQTPTETMRLIDMWKAETDPTAKQLLEIAIGKANAPTVLEQKGQTARDVARTRANATTTSADIRARAPSKTAPRATIPQGWTVVK